MAVSGKKGTKAKKQKEKKSKPLFIQRPLEGAKGVCLVIFKGSLVFQMSF